MSAVSVNLRELEDELLTTKASVEAWSNSRNEAAESTRDSHVRMLQDQTAKLNNLKAKQASLGAAAQHVKQKLQLEESEKVALHIASVAANQEHLSVHKTVITYKELLEQKERECFVLEQAVKLDEGIKRKKIEALRKALLLYSSRLGLDFKQGSDELQLIFTQIDASQPSRQFLLAVKAHEDKTYQVTNCYPKISCLAELLAQLNSTGNFSSFVKSIRAAWSSETKASSAGHS